MDPLIQAAMENNYDDACRLLAAGANVNAMYAYRSPLIISIEHNNTHMVRLFCLNRADQEVRNEFGYTAVGIAALHGYFVCLDAVLLYGNPDVRQPDYTTALMIAAEDGYLDCVKLLLQHNANVHAVNGTGSTALHIAVENGHLRIARALLNCGANVDAMRENGRTPLLIAADSGYTDIVLVLLRQYANILLQDANGDSALMLAVGGGHTGTVRLLLEWGADVEQTDLYGTTPLFYAAQEGFRDIVNDLMAAGATTFTTRLEGTHPLMIAAQEGHEDVVEAMVSPHDINRVRIDGQSPLLVAVINDRFDCARILLWYGADVRQPDIFSLSPLQAAANNDSGPMAELLCNYGADPTDVIPRSTGLIQCYLTSIQRTRMQAVTGNLDLLRDVLRDEFLPRPSIWVPLLCAESKKNFHAWVKSEIDTARACFAAFYMGDVDVLLRVYVECENPYRELLNQYLVYPTTPARELLRLLEVILR